MPEIVPISDLRRRTRDVMDAVHESGEVYITQYGRPVAVLVDHEQYERLLRQCQEPNLPDVTGSHTEHLSGLHREVWQDVDANAYLQQERDAWKPSKTD
jgi:prevent-host-death family protein